MITYPPTSAKEIARILDSDPIVAEQIKEYLSNERLIELLGIDISEKPEIADFSDTEIMNEVRQRGLDDCIINRATTEALIDEIKSRATR